MQFTVHYLIAKLSVQGMEPDSLGGLPGAKIEGGETPPLHFRKKDTEITVPAS